MYLYLFKLLIDCVGVSSSPCSSLIGDFQTVEVGRLLAASSLLQLAAVARQEGPCWVAGRRMPLAVVLRVPLISCMVTVFMATILLSNYNKIDCFRDHMGVRGKCSNPVTWLLWTCTWRSRCGPRGGVLVSSGADLREGLPGGAWGQKKWRTRDKKGCVEMVLKFTGKVMLFPCEHLQIYSTKSNENHWSK